MFNLETALSTWRHQYKYSRAFKGRDLDELEQHLRDQVAFMVEQGETEEEAFRAAVAELGSQHETESEFRSVAWMKTRDRREVGKEIRYQVAMLANYMRVAARNLRKNRIPSTINIVGLSVAIAVVMVCYAFVSAALTEDHHHEHADDIFLVHQVTQEDEGEQWWGHSPVPLGPALEAESPLIEAMTRYQQGSIWVYRGDNRLQYPARWVDDDFFDMFDFELRHGSTTGFGQQQGVVISLRQAEANFGSDDPIGQIVEMDIGDQERVQVPVIAVAEEFPVQAGIQFLYLMPMSMYPNQAADDWAAYASATFIQRRPGVDPAALRTELNRFLDRANAPVEFETTDWQLVRFEVDALKDVKWNRSNVRRSVIRWIPWAPIIVLSVISGLLLLLACFNYMNISLAMATKRLREIGVRKAVGGSRQQLVIQFLTENLQVSLISLILGVLIASQALLPAFSIIANVYIGLGFTEHLRVWLFMAAIVFGTGLLSGAYPAFYISAFRPTVIFQKRTKLQSRRPLAHTFLAFQFVLAFLTMSAGIVLTMNGAYLADKDWGYDADQRILYHTDDEPEFQLVASTLAAQPGVSHTIHSRDVVGFTFDLVEVESDHGPEEGFRSYVFGGDADYMSFMGIDLVMGQALSDSTAGFGPEAIVVNETFVAEAKLDDPIGSVVMVDSTARTIVGVAADFHHEDFYSDIDPALFENVPPEEHRFITAMVGPEFVSRVLGSVEAVYDESFPNRDITMRFQDEAFAGFREENNGIAGIFSFVSLLALLISCLSIYALSAQNVLNRLKEIGVRKVMGGDAFGIAHLVNRRYVIILSIGALVSLPIAWIGLDALLNDIYAYSMDMNLLPFVITYAIILGVALLTITVQTRSINRARPADILRVE